MKTPEALATLRAVIQGIRPGGPMLDEIDEDVLEDAILSVARALRNASGDFRDRFAQLDTPICIVATYVYCRNQVEHRIALRSGIAGRWLDFVYSWIEPVAPNIPQSHDGEYRDARAADLLDFAFEIVRLSALGALDGLEDAVLPNLAGVVHPA